MSLLDQVDAPTPTVSLSSAAIASALERIRQAGFTVQLQPGDKLLVTPRSRLTEVQVQWITANKPAILAYLRTLPDESVQNLQDAFPGATVQAITLDSLTPPEPMVPLAEPPLVRCLDCRHGTRALPGDEMGAWRLCEVGLGGYFALKKRLCAGFAEKIVQRRTG